MNLKELTYLVLSDIHLGHKRNKTDEIVHNLREYFKDYRKEIDKCKIIFIAGDIFDTLLSNNSNEYLLATEWLTELILLCKHRKIKLRILEGTPSHDWRQAKLISNIIEQLKIELDYKYISTLTIEHMLDYDLDILYIPDEFKPRATETYDEVLEEIKRKQPRDNKVDIAIMHGQFHFQLPGIELESSHNEEDYLNLTRYFINIGHIHTPSVYSRILAQGSFDRLAHNEEEDKGGMLCTLYKDGKYKFEFLKNKRAKTFLTLNYMDSSLTTEEISKDIHVKLSELRDNSYVRIHVPDIKSLDSIKDEYPYLHFKIQNKEEKKLKIGEDILKAEPIESFTITPENINELVLKDLESKLTVKQLTIAREELELAKIL